jgi:hypothetical protein
VLNIRQTHLTLKQQIFCCSGLALILLLSALAVQAQQPTSQVVAFNGTIPGQPDGPVALRFRLYNVDMGGTILFEETQTVTVAAEKFTVRIGDATDGGIPALVFRNNPSVWIAFALDATPDTQIGSRTAITSSGYAHSASTLAGPVVTSINTLSGDVTLAGSPPITITPGECSLTIGAAGVLTGVAHDFSLSGDGTGGAPLGIATGGVTTPQLADRAVTGPKIATPLVLTSSTATGYAGVFNGKVKVSVLGPTGSMNLCRNGANEIATCSSSLRYKTDVRPFLGGLDIVNRLRPIAFTWKQDGMRAIGLAAEEVEKVEPLLAFRNDKGEIEGVRYNELSAVFVNAFAEQQAQIQTQQAQIKQQQAQIKQQQQALEALKRLVCLSQPDAEACK